MEVGMIAGIGAAAVVVLLVIWLAAAYNGFVRLRNSVEEGFATMDVYLKKRRDLVPNLVDTVKGYAAFESETLDKVVQARNAAAAAQSVADRVAGEELLTGALKQLFALAEAYPDLKAGENYRNLMDQLSTVENDIASGRKYYNAVVREFNTKVEVFPGNLVAAAFHFVRMPMFEAAEGDREAVKVEF